MPIEDVFSSLLAALDALAVAEFAVTGALVASRKQMDIFGFALLGTVTGVGGGGLPRMRPGARPRALLWLVAAALSGAPGTAGTRSREAVRVRGRRR